MSQVADFPPNYGDGCAESVLRWVRMATTLEQGVIVKGRYRLETLLGEGGYGTVWRATQLNVNRQVAIKFLKAFAADEAAVRRFEREARALGRVQHPNCVTMLDYGRSEQGAYLVTEFLDGERLDHWAEGDHDFASVMTVARQVLAALEHAHGQRIVHRDLKPANIVVSRNTADELVVKVLDFGIASVVGAKRGDITKTGEVFGTPGYMAPEQLLGENNVGPAADLYSFGVLLYQLIEGRKVFTAGSGIEVALKHLTHDPPPMEKPVPDGLRDLVMRLLAKQAGDRFQSAEEVARAISRIGSAEHPLQVGSLPRLPAIATPPVTPPTRGVMPVHHQEPSGESPMGYGPTGYGPTSYGVGSTSGVHVRPEPLPNLDTPKLALIALGLLTVVGSVGFVLYTTMTQSDTESPSAVSSASRANSKLLRGNRTVERRKKTSNPTVQLEAPEAVVPPPVEIPPVSAGCGGRTYRQGFQQLSIMVGDLDRALVNAYIPADYDPDHPHQTMIAIHDTGQSARELFRELRLAQVADRDKVVIIFPETTSLVHPWKEPAEYLLGHHDLMAARKELCLDNRDVLLLGHGSGGHAAQKLACEIEHVGAMAQSAYRKLEDDKSCDHGDLPYVFLAPTEDGRDPIEGGGGCLGGHEVLTLEGHIDVYREMYGCEEPKQRIARHGDSVCYTWACETPFEACEIAGGRPLPRQGPRLADCEGKAADFPYRDTMWNFLIANTRTADQQTDQGQ